MGMSSRRPARGEFLALGPDSLPSALSFGSLSGAESAPAAKQAQPSPQDTALYRALDVLPQLIWMADHAGVFQYRNSAWEEFTGRAKHESRTSWLSCLHPEDEIHATPMWLQALQTGTAFQGEYRLRHHSGAWRWALLAARCQVDSHEGGSSHWYISGMDVHERVMAQQDLYRSLGMQKNMLDVSVDCIKILHPNGTLAHMNKSGCTALGVSPDSGFGQRWLTLLPESIRAKGQRALALAVRGKNARFAGMSVIPGQAPQYWDNILTPILDTDGQTSSILCVSRDVTLQRTAENRLREASERDELTNLPNRRWFNQNLKHALSAAQNAKNSLGLILLDLDHFKHVNDTLGHPAGDHLLRVLSRRLQTSLPPQSMVARLGGDEFAIVAQDIESDEDLIALAQQVREQIEAPVTYAGKLINGGMSIGCAMYPRDAYDAASLMKSADTALNDLKAGGRGGVRMFNTDMMQTTEHAAAQLDRARLIVRTDAVMPYYQPKVRLSDGAVVGFEALLRWHDEEGNLQMPASVWAAFKDYELAASIGEIMRTKVFSHLRAWRRQGLPLLPVSLNAAPVEFLRDDYAERLLDHLEHMNLSTSLVEVEVTEHMLGERGSEYVIRALKMLKAHGVRIALDDFGTGQSSLAHLRDYPVDCVKIDKDFVQRIEDDPTILAIVKAVGLLGPSLQLDLVAEGVESPAQSRILQDAGYQIGQGYLFGRAWSDEQVMKYLQQV